MHQLPRTRRASVVCIGGLNASMLMRLRDMHGTAEEAEAALREVI